MSGTPPFPHPQPKFEKNPYERGEEIDHFFFLVFAYMKTKNVTYTKIDKFQTVRQLFLIKCGKKKGRKTISNFPFSRGKRDPTH